jgi:hypothetical protein
MGHEWSLNKLKERWQQSRKRWGVGDIFRGNAVLADVPRIKDELRRLN